MNTLLLLPGFCEDSSIWDDFMAHLSNDVLVLRMDYPGIGTNPLPDPAEMSTYAHAVYDMMERAGIDRVVLAGHSMGGYVAMEFAARWPQHLAGISLFHSHPFADTPERREIRQRGIEMLRSGKKDLYVSQLFPGLFAKAFAEAYPEIINGLIAKAKQQSTESIIAALEAMITRQDHGDTMRHIACPVQFIIGTEDKIVDPGPVLRASMWPEVSDVQLLHGVGHMGMLEAPETAAQAIEAFWRNCNREVFESSEP